MKIDLEKINCYKPGIEFRNFPELSGKMESYYDIINDYDLNDEITPRYVFEFGKKIAFRNIFYYIDMLYDNQPKNLIDVGCGECTWKRWFPNIIGFDPNINPYSQQDFVDTFDQDFSKGHTKWYDVGMAINSIHFITWDYIPDQISHAMNIVKDRFLFTFNFEKIRDKPVANNQELTQLIFKIIQQLPYEIVMFDFIDKPHWFYTNGSVQFILSHRS
jgi:hypothetical protein